MSRLDEQRKVDLEPVRRTKALEELEKKKVNIIYRGENHCIFEYKKATVRYYYYTGWASGKPIKDGRGLKNLLKQLNN